MRSRRRTQTLGRDRPAAGRAWARPSKAARPADCSRRQRLHALLAICSCVRRGLEAAGIDPGGVPALRVRDTCEAALAALGDPPDLPALGGPPDDAVADFAAAAKFDAKIQALVQHFRRRPAIRPAQSSLAELYAWCLARPPAEQAGGSP